MIIVDIGCKLVVPFDLSRYILAHVAVYLIMNETVYVSS